MVGRGAPQDLTNLRVEVIAIFGPTASGKSDVADTVAARLGTDVVSADALQVYRGLEILTNQSRGPTRLVGIRSLEETMSVGEYATLAHREIDGLVGRSGAAVVAGGTGLYLRAALADMDIPPPVGDDVRRRWERLYDADPAAAFERLASADPVSATSLHVNDRRRVVRALELAEAGASLVPETDSLWSERVRRPTLVVGLEVPPEELDRRIEERTNAMLEQGVVEEVRAALTAPISHTARHAIGLDDLASLDWQEARARIVVRTRRYAAYQRKWMRRIPGLVPLDGTRRPDEVADEILGLARAR